MKKPTRGPGCTRITDDQYLKLPQARPRPPSQGAQHSSPPHEQRREQPLDCGHSHAWQLRTTNIASLMQPRLPPPPTSKQETRTPMARIAYLTGIDFGPGTLASLA